MNAKLQTEIEQTVKDKNILFIMDKNMTGILNTIKQNYTNKYSLDILTYLDFLDKKLIEKKLQNANTQNVFFMFNNTKTPVLIINEVEMIKTKILKNTIKKIQKTKPIILIGYGECTKIKKELENMCNFFEITSIEDDVLKTLKCDKIKNIKQITNNNINKVKNIKKYLDNTKEDLKLIENNVGCNTELYINVANILNNKMKTDDIVKYYRMEKILLPLLIHENYKKFISLKINKKDQRQCIEMVADNMMKADIINKFIFNKHYWLLQDLFSILSCQKTSYYINEHFVTKKNKRMQKIDYTKILTKNAAIFMNFKQYNLLTHKMKNIDKYNKDSIKYIFRNVLLLLVNDVNVGNNVLKKYNLTKSDITKILRYAGNIIDDKQIKQTIITKLKKIK